MELRESIESINEKLVNMYGKWMDGRPNFRVVFSHDQIEKRWLTHTKDGFELLHPIVSEAPKYRHYIVDKYVLERLIPIVGETDLVEKTSYEPAWVFQDKNQNYLPPFFEGCMHVIESLLSVIDKAGSFKKYKDPTFSPEYRAAELKKVYDQLWGNESDVADHLSYKTGVVVPENMEIREAREEIQTAESKIELSKLVH